MISIIIPCYKDKAMALSLITYLESITIKTETEILLCIPENSKHEYNEEMLHLVTSKRISRASQMNAGAIKAKGGILIFLHADVVPPSNFISSIKNVFTEGFEAGFFSYQFDKENFFLKINARFTKKDGLFAGGGDQCLFISREKFFQLGSYNENFVIMEDFDFIRKLRKNNIKYKIINNDLIVSARKYNKNSYLKVNLVNLLVFVLFLIHVNPRQLKKIYSSLLST